MGRSTDGQIDINTCISMSIHTHTYTLTFSTRSSTLEAPIIYLMVYLFAYEDTGATGLKPFLDFKP